MINFLILVAPIPSPAPSSNEFVDTVDAIPILKSPSSILSTSTINSVPSTYKSPLILTDPEVVPAPAGEGSIQISDGPSIYAVFPAPFAIDIPIPVVVNLPVAFNDAVVIIPDTFTLSSSVCPLTSNPVNVPTDVMFVCAAVCNVPDNVSSNTSNTGYVCRVISGNITIGSYITRNC